MVSRWAIAALLFLFQLTKHDCIGTDCLPTYTLRISDPTERFIPPNVQDTKLQACVIGGNMDGTTDAFVIAQYTGERYAEYRATIARRNSYKAAVADCIIWFHDVSKAFEAAQMEKKQ